MTNLRPYQKECLESIRDHFYQGVTCQGAAGPTGTGKTCIAASVRIGIQMEKS